MGWFQAARALARLLLPEARAAPAEVCSALFQRVPAVEAWFPLPAVEEPVSRVGPPLVRESGEAPAGLAQGPLQQAAVSSSDTETPGRSYLPDKTNRAMLGVFQMESPRM